MVGTMAFAVACLPAGSHADFLYIPAGQPAPVAVEVDERAVREWAPEAVAAEVHEPARTETKAAEADIGLWRVHAGDMLREVLDRWGSRAGVDVLFLTDRRYRLHEAAAFAGSFGEAAEALFAALSHLPRPPVGEWRQAGRTLAVLHRTRAERARSRGNGS